MSTLMHWWVNLRHGGRPISMASALNNAEKALFLLGGGHDGDLLGVIAHIVNSFSLREVGIVFPEGGKVPRLGMQRIALFPLRRSDVNLLALPKREFVKRIRAGGYHLAVDLDATGEYTWAYICLKSGAPLRLGFGCRARWPYHNMVIIPRRSNRLT